jgi:hypothetical protein
MWLKKLQMKFRKNAFENTVLLACNSLIFELLESDNSNARDKLHETTGNHCFDIIRKKGSQEINDFREDLIEIVSGIVQSDNPIVSMRKKLIELIHTDILNRTFFTEKFADRREELYENINKFDEEGVASDEISSVLYILSEAKICILRMLQHTYFEEAGKDDWFERYSKAFSIYTEMLYEVGLQLKDEKDCSIDGVVFPVVKKQVEHFQEKLIGEVIR